MTDHDIQLLCIGITLGMYIILISLAIGSLVDDRRDRKAVRAAEAQLEAARERARS